MADERISVEQLATAGGVSRRAVRFYVERGLLPPPQGRGRGAYYTPEHLQRLRQILEWQRLGYSLDAIEKLLAGEALEPAAEHAAPAHIPRRRQTPVATELWTRLKLTDGVELHFDATKYNPEIDRLLAVRPALLRAFGLSGEAENEDERPAEAVDIMDSDEQSSNDADDTQSRRKRDARRERKGKPSSKARGQADADHE